MLPVRHAARWPPVLLAAATCLLTGCRAGELTDGGAPAAAFTIASPGTSTAGVLAVVTGVGLPSAIVVPLLSMGGGQFAGALASVPRGPARTLAARAYLGTVPAFSATRIIDLMAGSAPVLVLVRPAEAAYAATVDSFTLALDDAAPFVAATTATTAAASTTIRLTVQVTYSLLQLGHVTGTPAPGVDVAWGSATPAVAAPAITRCTTDASGTCSVPVAVSPAATAGQTADLIAIVAGVATRMRLTVG